MSNLFTNSFLDLDSLFRDATYIWERRTPLCITPAPDPFYLETSNAYCISLSVIMLDHKRLVHRHHRVKFIGNWVTTYPHDYRRIVPFWRRIDWTLCEKASRETHQGFPFLFPFFFFKFYIGKFYISLFSFWKDRSVKRETDVHRCSLILRWFSKWSFHVEWLNAFNNLYWIMEFMSHLRNIPRRYLPMSLGKWDWFTFHEYYIISYF